jgi:hypothetical protein
MKVSEQPEYQIWSQMKGRCSNKNHKKYSNYGGRGINVCDRWTEKGTGYTNFIQDMGIRPTNKHSIERVDVNGNYEPSNCIWILISEQGWNKQASADVKPGDIFGKLTVISETEGKIRNNDKSRIRRYFIVRCQCGGEKSIRMDKLRERDNQSCGNRSCNKYAPTEHLHNETI